MKPAILLIGTNGQVGRELRKTLPSIGDVTALDRSRLDIVQPEEIRDLVPVAAVHRPDPEATGIYDNLFAEFPKFYKAQRRMFARLAR